MAEYYYPKPSLTNLPEELGKKIFKQMDQAKTNIEELERKSLELKLEMVKARNEEERNKK